MRIRLWNTNRLDELDRRLELMLDTLDTRISLNSSSSIERDKDLRRRIGELSDEMVAVQTTLGIMPHGGYRDLAERLDHLQGSFWTSPDRPRRFPWKLHKPWVRR